MGAQAAAPPAAAASCPPPFLFALLPRGNRQASGRTSLSFCFLFPTLGDWAPGRAPGPPLGDLCLDFLTCEGGAVAVPA